MSPVIRRKERMIQISTRVSKTTLVKLEVIIKRNLMKDNYADRNKLTRKAIDELVNNEENQQLIMQFRKDHPKEYKSILAEVSKLKK